MAYFSARSLFLNYYYFFQKIKHSIFYNNLSQLNQYRS